VRMISIRWMERKGINFAAHKLERRNEENLSELNPKRLGTDDCGLAQGQEKAEEVRVEHPEGSGRENI